MEHIWTDGSCSPNPGPGGWAWLREDGTGAYGGTPPTTNNRMELVAVIMALKSVKVAEHVMIHTDSQYISNAYNLGWMKRWRKFDYQRGKKAKLANRDLWMRLDDLVLDRYVTFRWTRGHAHDKINAQADLYAAAGRAFPGQQRRIPPEDLAA